MKKVKVGYHPGRKIYRNGSKMLTSDQIDDMFYEQEKKAFLEEYEILLLNGYYDLIS